MSEHKTAEQHEARLQKARLDDAFTVLGPVAREALCRIGARLAEGARVYGDDFRRHADWHSEMLAECADGLVYATLALIEEEREPTPRSTPLPPESVHAPRVATDCGDSRTPEPCRPE